MRLKLDKARKHTLEMCYVISVQNVFYFYFGDKDEDEFTDKEET